MVFVLRKYCRKIFLGSSKKRAKHKAAWCMIEQCYAKLQLTDNPLIKTIEQYLYVNEIVIFVILK